MLRACHRVLRPGGVLAFLTIQGDPAAERRHPQFFDDGYLVTDTPYADLMVEAGFVDVVAEDVSADYHATLEAWHRHAEDLADGLREALGPEAHAEKQARRTRHLAAARDGATTRVLVSGRRPGGS